MSEVIEFSLKDIKPMRSFYYSLWLILLAVTGVFLVFIDPSSPILEITTGEYLKSVVILIALASIPAVFGWFTMKLKKINLLESKGEKLEAYTNIWKVRSGVVFVVLLLTIVAYMLVLDKSMSFMVAIAAFVYLYSRPSVSTLKNELNTTPNF